MKPKVNFELYRNDSTFRKIKAGRFNNVNETNNVGFDNKKAKRYGCVFLAISLMYVVCLLILF